MSISVQNLLVTHAGKVGASPASADFQAIFLDAINYAIDDINERLGIATTAVSDVESEIDLDEQTYKNVISMGIDYHVADHGTWNTQGVDGLRKKFFDKLGWAQMTYLNSQDLNVRFGDLDE